MAEYLDQNDADVAELIAAYDVFMERAAAYLESLTRQHAAAVATGDQKTASMVAWGRAGAERLVGALENEVLDEVMVLRNNLPNAQNVVGAVVNAGVLAFTQGFADALAPQGIRVVALNPGIVDTPLFARQAEALMAWEGVREAEALERVRLSNPLGGLHRPEEVAAVVAFLVSDVAARITATSLDMGGRGRAL